MILEAHAEHCRVAAQRQSERPVFLFRTKGQSLWLFAAACFPARIKSLRDVLGTAHTFQAPRKCPSGDDTRFILEQSEVPALVF